VGQGGEEVGFGLYQVQIDFAAAVKLDSAVKRLSLENMGFQPELLDDPGGCDRLSVMKEEAIRICLARARAGNMISSVWKGLIGSFSRIFFPSNRMPMLT